jgi:hypothetical protein
MVSAETAARVVRSLYFVTIIALTVCATLAGVDGAWGALAVFVVVAGFLVVPVIIDGALWDRKATALNQPGPTEPADETSRKQSEVER